MKIDDFRLLRIVTCWLAIFVLPITSICQFPVTWSGKWFQSGLLHDVRITTTDIESKGICLEHDGDRYLLEDKEENCRRCVVIHEKHYNVLQYKETYCFPKDSKDSLEMLCEKITGDAALYSMFRLDAKPIPCPFKGGPPFTFTYNRGSGDCKTPVSKSDSCTDDSRMLLRYQACPDVHNSESTVEELTCLANWRDGSMKYMVGKLEHKMTSTDEDRYRCFVYNEGENKVYDVAQSGDATCNGLPSATEGSRTMKLTKVNITHHERANCKFPSWLTDHHTWHLLDHSKTYHFSSHNGTVRVTYDRDRSENVLEMRAVCNSILASSEGQIIISAHITVGCESGYRCMAFYRRDGHVIEIQQSTREVQNSEEACSSQNFNSQTLPYITLITPYLRRQRCPFLGRYTVSNNVLWNLAASTKQLRENTADEKVNCEKGKQMLSLGCTKPETMEFQSECNSDVTAGYSCHGDWIDSNGTSYLIAIPLSEVSKPPDKYCFVIYNLPETLASDGSRRGRRLQLYSLTKSCRRDLHQDSSDQHWMFNITHHADCDGLVNGGSSPLSRSHISFLMCILVSMVSTLAAVIKPVHISR